MALSRMNNCLKSVVAPLVVPLGAVLLVVGLGWAALYQRPMPTTSRVRLELLREPYMKKIILSGMSEDHLVRYEYGIGAQRRGRPHRAVPARGDVHGLRLGGLGLRRGLARPRTGPYLPSGLE